MAETTALAAADMAEAGAGVAGRRTVSNTERDMATERLDQLTDIGADEANQVAVVDQTRSWNANTKRTYDMHQSQDFRAASQAMSADNVRENIINQALQNAVETANMVAKQAVRHADVAIDRQWNVDEQTWATAKSGVEADAVVATMIAALADAVAARIKQ